MKLIKIDGIYINPERVDGLTRSFVLDNAILATNIFCGGSKKTFVVKKNIEEVAQILNTI